MVNTNTKYIYALFSVATRSTIVKIARNYKFNAYTSSSTRTHNNTFLTKSKNYLTNIMVIYENNELR